MIAKAKYFGFYSLGSDVTVSGVHIMQREWKIVYRDRLLVIGSKKTKLQGKISVLGKDIYCAEEKGTTVYFAAKEYGTGNYHIFLFNDKVSNKLHGCALSNPVVFQAAVIIDVKNLSIKIYGRYISPRDINGLCPDSFFKFIKEDQSGEDCIFYFTNTGTDEQRLFVNKPTCTEHNESHIIIGKAEKIRWESTIYEQGKTCLYAADYFVENNLVKKLEYIDGKQINESALCF